MATIATDAHQITVALQCSTEVSSVTPVHDVTVGLTADRADFTGNVDGHAFTLMLANRETARREREKALRRAAAWQAILDAGLARP